MGLAAILLGIATVGLDSAVNVDFPRITQHFALAIPQIQWVVVSYTLPSASLVLAFGRLADIVGARRVLLAGALWSAAAFLVCAAAQGFGWLLGGRILQGIGAGLLLGSGPALATQLYPEADRPRALAIYTVGLSAAGALGPVLGGALLSRFDWSSVFWARAPLAALAFLLAWRIPRPERLAASVRAEFDFANAAWLVATMAAAVLAIGTARTGLPAALAAAASGVAALMFARTQRRARRPVIRTAALRDPGLAAMNAASLLINLAGFAVLLLVPFALARIAGLSEAVRGSLLAASPSAVALAAPLAARFAHARFLLPGGAALTACGLLCCAALPAHPAGLALAMLAAGAGQGLFQVGYLDRLSAALPLAERGVAGSLAMLTRTLGLVLGATALMAVFQGWAQDFAPAFRAAFAFAALLAACAAALLMLSAAVRTRPDRPQP